MNAAPLTWNPNPSTPRIVLPANATDTHCHVFGPASRFPYDPESTLQPGDATKEQLFALHDMLGISRCVIVQSGVHGFDNRAVADAIAARKGRYLGVALAPPDIAAQALADLDRQGFRGLRFNYMSHLAPGASPEALRALAPRLADIGWHLQVHMDGSLVTELTPVLASLPVTVVIDHMGRINASRGQKDPAFEALLALLENGHVWVKVSGSERVSRRDAPYEDAIPFARRLVETYPDRVLWGTDWPHPNLRAAPPDDGILVGLLARIAPDEMALQALLVDNPMRLYRFPDGGVG